MNKLLVIDNYDSFTYNLVHAVQEIMQMDADVRRNDEISIPEIDEYDSIILSPGPGLPDEAGLLKTIIEEFHQTKKILGVCLGLQAIGEVFGARLLNLKTVYHGIKSKMILTDYKSKLFEGIPAEFEAGRYHSWVIDKGTLPDSFAVSCFDVKGVIMAIEHRSLPVFGLQFHPESIMTPLGTQILKNFLAI